MPQSQVSVQVLPQHWQVQARVPEDRLMLALAQAAQQAPAELPAALTVAAVRGYAEGRLRAVGHDGQPWAIVGNEVLPPEPGTNEWLLRWQLRPAGGGPAESVRLHYELITREVATHVAVFTLTQDWERGDLPHAPRLLGSLTHTPLWLDVHRSPPTPWAAAISLAQQGFWHLMEGADHLLFLATLWLTAGLSVQAGHWQAAPTQRAVWQAMLWRVSAFTLGHSLALMAVALHWLPPAGPLVEALIAATVALCALHALKPLFPGRELLLVTVFGAIHGSAFAEGLAALQLDTQQVLSATLAFNLGLELAQVLALVLMAPVALLLCRSSHPRATLARQVLAVGTLLMALVWLVQRLA
ncbi:HupE/UreJ family protein [Ideonella paludis]|uniref:HupE/UreJ family protein n=1 Tax=Ideonella paludis TaxID=1233411 RepID=A0ABS5DYB0_9BURK|nr:HupE/UreJ family protein [Ideonella paludis]MBQ0936133.1 HupE/UreJ family protein [Ideonella paludis]